MTVDLKSTPLEPLALQARVVQFAGGNQSSAGGLLLLREAERKLGVCRRLAEAMPDRRDPDRVRHAMFEMVMARASAIALTSAASSAERLASPVRGSWYAR